MTKKILQPKKPNLYCGEADTLPDRYDDFGTPYDCLKKGFGAGKASVSEDNTSISPNTIKLIAEKLSIKLTTAKGKSKTLKVLLKEIDKNIRELQAEL